MPNICCQAETYSLACHPEARGINNKVLIKSWVEPPIVYEAKIWNAL